MRRSARVITAYAMGLLLLMATGCTLLKAQAATEYTLGTSKAAAGAAGLGNVMNRRMSEAARKVSGNLKTQIHQSPAQVMKENLTALEKQAGDDGGVLRISSDPDDAAVFVDGQLVARTPAEIKTPAGKHQVMVTRPDRDQWTKEVSIVKGKTVKLHAKLVNTNPSVISLSFPEAKK